MNQIGNAGEYLAGHFESVQIIAVKRKLFPDLSEDCWLLYAEGFGLQAKGFLLSPVENFVPSGHPPSAGTLVSLRDWCLWRRRLRPFLLSSSVRTAYREIADDPASVSLGEIAKVGIGYVTGANDFFHLKPSRAEELGIPSEFLMPTVRSSEQLVGRAITRTTVNAWLNEDSPNLLLRIGKHDEVPSSIRRYLNSKPGTEASKSYKCRNRDPWYVVPDVSVPNAFLSYMSGQGVSLAANRAGCACANTVHAIRLYGRVGVRELQRRWVDGFTTLSCEIEGHPLGGGVLKLEPREASRVTLAAKPLTPFERSMIEEGIEELRTWRHYGQATVGATTLGDP